MVYILDGNSEHVAHAKRSLRRKKIRFVTGLGLIILNRSNKRDCPYTCAPISKLPSNIKKRP